MLYVYGNCISKDSIRTVNIEGIDVTFILQDAVYENTINDDEIIACPKRIAYLFNVEFTLFTTAYKIPINSSMTSTKIRKKILTFLIPECI
jgi:hypothetical protein